MSISQNFPATRPSLNINFARSQTLDPRITFTRTTTGTCVGPDGYIEVIPADQPRFDHDPVTGECLGLLIEESKSNLITYSDDFGISSTIWRTDTTGTTVSTNQDISPSGELTSDRLYETTSSLSHNRYQGVGLVSTSTSYTWSVFVKSGTRSKITLSFGYSGVKGGGKATFDLSTSTVYSVTLSADEPPASIDAKIKDYGNGWYRCSMSLIPTNSVNQYFCGIFILNDSYTENYTGNTSNYISVWGAQLEQGNYPTSYIPTVAGTVTKGSDDLKIDGSNFTNFYNPIEGSVYCSFRSQVVDVKYVLGISNNSSSELIYIRTTSAGSDSAMRDNGSDVAYKPIAYSRDDSTLSKHIVSYKENDFIVSAQGQISTADIICTVPTPTNISIGSLYSYNHMNGTISQLTYYPVRLTNSQLQTLTK